MKKKILKTLLLIPILLLMGCENDSQNVTYHKENPINKVAEQKTIEIDLSTYFNGLNGSAVFYNPKDNIYEIYNPNLAKEERSPCSTFKIVSTLAGLEYGIIKSDDSMRKWNMETFWNEKWNKDMSLEDAFKTSCVWYYRKIIDEIGVEKMQTFLDKLDYGNKDISDWEGRLNQNNNNRDLTGFWIESSLKISPLEQVKILESIFKNETPYDARNVEFLKKIMKIEQSETKADIYGKTGYGKFKDTSLDSWFIGMFESKEGLIYFALHLSETDNPNVSSSLAKSMAIQIINDKFLE